jgi:surface polysaccharide O-acyltransferase-like enzyme
MISDRIVSADFLRIFAIFLMLALHSTERLADNDIFTLLSFSLTKACVPLFVMVSGALILRKNEGLGLFIKKEFLELLRRG